MGTVDRIMKRPSFFFHETGGVRDVQLPREDLRLHERNVSSANVENSPKEVPFCRTLCKVKLGKYGPRTSLVGKASES